MANLYQLTNEVEELFNKLVESSNEDGEVDAEIQNALMVSEQEFDKKAIAVATVQRRFEAEAQMIDEEIKRLQDLKKRATNNAERLKNNLSEACLRLGKDKIDGISAKISFRLSTKTVVENENELPEEYFNITITKKPNLTKIKESIQNGIEIKGARLEEFKNIQIK